MINIPFSRLVSAVCFGFWVNRNAAGNNHAKDGGDRQWWHRDVPGRLKQLHEDSYMITIFSNQAGLA
jgi:hypothetical protein